MDNYSQNELDSALQLLSSTISKCEKIQLKFAEGTSQYSLLKNRIKALYISRALIENDRHIGMYTQQDLEKALSPVLSIIKKTEKAQMKHGGGTVQYKRFDPIISAMYISKAFIENALSKPAH